MSHRIGATQICFFMRMHQRLRCFLFDMRQLQRFKRQRAPPPPVRRDARALGLPPAAVNRARPQGRRRTGPFMVSDEIGLSDEIGPKT